MVDTTGSAGPGAEEPPPAPPPLGAVCRLVCIGASAGGLEASRKLLAALPAPNGMAFILVQHLDPNHESMMAELLAGDTPMVVVQATDNMPIAPDHVYVIPPGSYLSASVGFLHLSRPQARHGARMPFDFLLNSLAEHYGDRAVCVILSGSGSDGSVGLRAVKAKGGLVIAQDPDEAAFDGMPRSAIQTGAVDLVLKVAGIADALIRHHSPSLKSAGPDPLAEIVGLMRSRTSHDFTHYKPGTLQRRIERRMTLGGVAAGAFNVYLALLRSDKGEIELLAKDLLIHTTSFFRDPEVFAVLAEQTIPDLIGAMRPDQPLRVWIAGCSTGEETWSLAMVLREQIVAMRRDIKLQIFASDIDLEAVATAREGVYPASTAAEVSPERLARFFSHAEQSYTVLPELRAVVVFTVHDVLFDPPFSRLDFISCRNLLIYLRPDAQAKVLGLFHFALREGGTLLLGSSETVGGLDDRFQLVSKAARLYRHKGRAHAGGSLTNAAGVSGSVRVPAAPGQGAMPSRQMARLEACRRLMMATYAPAAVLINRDFECLYFLGPTDRYLRMAPGHPTHDLLTLAPDRLRVRLRSAIQRCIEEKKRVVTVGGRVSGAGPARTFAIDVQHLATDSEALLLVCFVESAGVSPIGRRAVPAEATRVAELETELDATRTELQEAIRNLELSSDEQKAINEEALSVNEEYQSTNEELLTSKEELQSLNEELTALNSQLQETLERQRTTSNDLQNVLYSTDVATLFLDTSLNIRFFTPAVRAVFSVIPSDVGRPLADLSSLTQDDELLGDARAVLRSRAAQEREVKTPNGAWYIRRILPYRTHDNGVEGVVITFADVTERKRTADALDAAKRLAEQANAAKSRFLAAASHDLRQPLQTLTLLQGLLSRLVDGAKARELVTRLDDTLGAMSGMLDTLLDINQIETGTVRPEIVSFALDDLLGRLREEFAYLAQAQGLSLRAVPCSLWVRSDPHLLEQIVRNLLSNALKYTPRGKVLLGCRRSHGALRIEVWDTGVGIPEQELHAIFEEYHQIDNSARERARGLGLGLSIVNRLAVLLGHKITVRSWLGKGSVFAIEVMRRPGPDTDTADAMPRGPVAEPRVAARRAGIVLVVEDDPQVRELLGQLVQDEGHLAELAADGDAALAMVAGGAVRPDLILADYNLPGGLNGLELARQLRTTQRRDIPVIILTGDISTTTLEDVAHSKCVPLHKPVRMHDLATLLHELLLPPPGLMTPFAAPDLAESETIFVVDDDSQVRDSLRRLLEAHGWIVRDFASCEAFLETYRPGERACLLVDAYLPGMSGLDLLRRLSDAGDSLPAIMITGSSDVATAVQAMKAGARDFIEKPIGVDELLGSVARALERARDSGKLAAWHDLAAGHIASLTPRQRQIMDLVLAGHPSKNIAADLGISQRTVENHRASIMKRSGANSLPELARLALAAAPAAAGAA